MKSTLKALVLLHTNEIAGGGEMSLFKALSNWRNDGVDSILVVRKPVQENLKGYLVKNHIKYYEVYFTNWMQKDPPNNKYEIKWRAKQNKKSVEHIKGIINSENPDFLVTNTITSPWLMLANNNRLPHIWYIREFISEGNSIEPIISKREIYNDINSSNSLVIYNSKSVEEFYSKFIELKSIINYPQVIKLESNSSTNNPFIDANSLKLITVGTIAKHKGQRDLIEAIAASSNKAELCLVGDFSDEDEERYIRSLITKLNIEDRVHIVGPKPDRGSYISLADVAVTPSAMEAFGRTTLEYMMMSKPVIGSNIGGTRELVASKKRGLLYSPGDIEQLTKCIDYYSSNKAAIVGHGINAKEFSEKFVQSQKSKIYTIKYILELATSQNRDHQTAQFSIQSHLESESKINFIDVIRSPIQFLKRTVFSILLFIK